MKLSVIIVNYNVKYYLEQCLRSVEEATRDIDSDIWVVDNASSDESVDYLRLRFPEVNFIANSENLGFSKANNMAIRRSAGEYVLLLNPDTVVGEDVLKECISFLDSHPDAGATGVAMLKDNGGFAWESRRGLPTPFTSFCKMSGLCMLFPESRVFGRYYMRYLSRHEENRIEVISGAFNMIRRSVLDKTGLLDESFFMYGEDIDLSCRILDAGYNNYYIPHQILHYKGESTQKSSFRYVHVFYQAMLIFFDKHYGRTHFWLSPFIRLAVYGRGFLDLCKNQKDRIVRLIRGGKPANARMQHVLFVGNRENAAEAERKCVAAGMKFDYMDASEETRPDGHLEMSNILKHYNYIVYDQSCWSNKRILHLFSAGHEKYSCVSRIGFYSPLSRMVILPDRIL